MSASSRPFRARFLQPVRSSDGAGGYATGWQEMGFRWVGLRMSTPRPGDEEISEARQAQVVDHRLTVPDDPETRAIAIDWRVELLGRVMDVRAVGVPIGGEIVMSVQEGVSP